MIVLRFHQQTERTSSPWVTVASTTALSELLQLCNFKRRDTTGLLRNVEAHSLIVNFLRPRKDSLQLPNSVEIVFDILPSRPKLKRSLKMVFGRCDVSDLERQ